MKAARKKVAAVGAELSDGLTVLGHIDTGGDEPVYIVWHHASWCPMACKVMTSLQRAREEANKLRAMSHPYIVRLFDVVPPGLLLMPFLEGQKLSELIDNAPKGQLGVSDALRVAIHIGSALTHVHARGYIHLDVKPDNIMIAPGGRPVVFDFETARLISANRPDRICGTNAYIAPEECLMGPVGPQADVFSLGVTLYEMLTGVVPFGARTPSNPFPQIKRMPVPLRQHRPSVPALLENIVMTCLEKDARLRPTLHELLPLLNERITRGPKMWPASFRPVTLDILAAKASKGCSSTDASVLTALHVR